MNEEVAYALIDAELRRLRQLPYSGLINLVGTSETKQVVGEDGKWYQLHIEALWDSAKGEHVRVIVAADDGGWRAFKPLTIQARSAHPLRIAKQAKMPER